MNTLSLKSALPISLILFTISLLPIHKASAQITPDSTLGAESSVVNQVNNLQSLIEGGAIRGQNLFHSFLEFNVGDGQSVHFVNPDGVNNILTRVTGSNISQILGILGVNGNANLFLLNPNGFIFGENASLDLRGSFTATTANIQLGENGFFSAKDVEGSSLLNIKPEAVFTNLQGQIENEANLVVRDGEKIVLIANKVVSGGNFTAPGEMIQLQANPRLKPDTTLGTENSQIETIDENNDRIIDGAARGVNLFHSFLEFNIETGKGVYFANPDGIENILARVTGDDISEIRGTLGVEGFANLYFINPNGLFFNQNASLDLNSSFFTSSAEAIIFDNFEYSALNPNIPPNLVVNTPTGLRVSPNSGDIVLKYENSQNLVLEEGDAGELLNTAQTINNKIIEPDGIQGELNNRNDADLYAISLEADKPFTATTVGGSYVDTRLFLFDSQGLGIIANEDVSENIFQSTLSPFTPTESGVYYLGISSYAKAPKSVDGQIFAFNYNTYEFKGLGKGGNSPLRNWDKNGGDFGSYIINFSNNNQTATGNLAVNSGQTLAFIGGNVKFEGIKIVSPDSNIEIGGLKQAGIISINSDLSLTFPEGITKKDVSLSQSHINVLGNQGGNININARNLTLKESGFDTGINEGLGFDNAQTGDIKLNVTQNTLIETGWIANSVAEEAKGNTGNILINTNYLRLNGSSIINSNDGNGNSGELIINAPEGILLKGNHYYASYLGNYVTFPEKYSGDIIINTSSLILNNDSSIGGSQFGDNIYSGLIDITATEGITLKQSEIVNISYNETPLANQQSGGIKINTSFLTLEDLSSIDASDFGGAGRGVEITATEGITLSANSVISVGTESELPLETPSGGVKINTSFLLLENGSQIDASNDGNGFGKGVDITATEGIILNDSEILSINGISDSEKANGRSGTVKINTSFLLLENGSQIDAANWSDGFAEGVEISATEEITLRDSAIFNNTYRNGNNGGILINTTQLNVTDRSRIDTSVHTRNGYGKAGDIQIVATEGITVSGIYPQTTSFIASEVRLKSKGDGGDINIDTPSLSLLEGGGQITSINRGEGNAGTININADTTDFFGGGIFSYLADTGKGNAGDIFVNTESLTMKAASQIDATTFGIGDAGTVNVNATESITLEDSQIKSRVADGILDIQVEGNSGGIIINTPILSLNMGGEINASTYGKGNAGLVEIFAPDNINLSQGSRIISFIDKNAEGNSAGIVIDTGNISLNTNSFISAETQGRGNAGALQMKSSGAITLDGNNTNISSLVSPSGIGKAGEIEIETTKLNLTNGSYITSSTFGQGDAGVVVIKAEENIFLDGENSNGLLRGILSQVESGAEGNSGGIKIETNILELINGGQIDTSTYGRGNAGAIEITAEEIAVTGENSLGLPSQVSSVVAIGAEGNSKGITINTSDLNLENGAIISAATVALGNAGAIAIKSDKISLNGESSLGFGSAIFSTVEASAQGNSGGITIDTSNLELKNGGVIGTNTSGKGNAGDIQIIAKNITAVGEDSQGFVSSISSGVQDLLSQGNSGRIEIKTNFLTLEEGGKVDATTFGQGDAGAILIKAQNINASGFSVLGFNTGLFSQVAPDAIGKSGGIQIETDFLLLKQGAVIDATTFGQGDAGAILIKAEDSITVGEDSQEFPSGIFSGVDGIAQGNSGGIQIETNFLALEEGSVIDASTIGKGNAGAIEINATGNILLMGKNNQGFGSGIYSVVGIGAEGNSEGISINSSNINLQDAGLINASTQGKGNAGNINITTSDELFLSGTILIDDLDIEIGGVLAVSLTTGTAGNITINTRKLNITEGAGIEAFTQGEGNAGNITVNASENLTLNQDSKLLVESSNSGKAGNIEINTPILTIGENAQLSATATKTSTSPTAGNISLNVNQLNISGELGIFAETQSLANAGNLRIQPYQTNPNLNLQFTNDGFISARTTDIGDGGSITMIAPETINIQGQGSITAATSGSGNAGSILIDSQQINLSDGVTISASTSNLGNSKNVTLNGNIINLDNATIQALTEGEGNPGSILISDGENNANQVNLSNNSVISTEIRAEGDRENAQTANITIQTDNLNLDSSTITASTNNNRDAGNITIPNAQNLNLINNSEITAITLGEGKAGNIEVNVNQTVSIDSGSKLKVETNSSGDAGRINIHSPNLTIGNDAELSARTNNRGEAGNITLETNKLNIAGELGIFAETEGEGKGGSLIINSQPNNPDLEINFTNEGKISASTFGSGDSGDINITAPESINIQGNGSIKVETQGEGNAGDIKIVSQNLKITGGMEITASTLQNNNATISSPEKSGDAGNIILDANKINLDDSQINAFTNSTANAGNINVNYRGENSHQISLTNSTISTEIRENGVATQPSNIILKTDNLTSNNSTITASTAGKGDAGQITIPNANTLFLDQNSTISTAILQGGVAQKPANININTNTLNLDNNSEITASAAGEGQGGNITINTTTPISLNNQARITSALDETGIGKGGNITIKAPSLLLDNQSEINASTLGIGEGGFVKLNIDNKINLDNASAIATAVEPTAIGIGGQIEIDTQQVNLNNQSQIRASTLGQGNADSITIRANGVNLIKGSKIRTETSSAFDAGNLSLTLEESLFISGNESGLFANTEANSTGNGGNITVNSPIINLENKGVIAVNSVGDGVGGDINISSNRLNLNNSEITAQTINTDGGEITLNVSELLILNNSSNITATAGTAQAGGDGGNIEINSPFILSIPSNPFNTITAEAFAGNGGNISITTNAIFGGEFLVIDASSQFGLDGEVIINDPNVDPTSGLIAINVNFVDVESLISKNPCADRSIRQASRSSFIISGKGGLPTQPEDILREDNIITPWIQLTPEVLPSEENKNLLNQIESPENRSIDNSLELDLSSKTPIKIPMLSSNYCINLNDKTPN